MRRRAAVLAALAAAAAAPAAPALAGEAVIGVTEGPDARMVRFDTAAPQALTAQAPLVGLLVGETVSGVDQRPASGQVYVLTSFNRVLVLDPATGALSAQGDQVDVGAFGFGQGAGVDFNPAVDRLRLVNLSNDSLRWDPLSATAIDTDAGTAGVQGDADLAFIASDVHVGDNPDVVAGAYDRNDGDASTPTTLFGIDSASDILVRQGAVDGNPADVAGGGSPNDGLLTTLGPLGANVDSTAALDVAGPPGGPETAWAAMRRAGEAGSTLFRVSLAPGAPGDRAAPVGPIAGSPLAGLAVLRGGAIRPVSPPPAGEGAGQAVVRVERAGEALTPASLAYRAVDRTAVAGRDYVAVAGTIAFGQGQRSAEVAVPLLQDAVAEPVKAFGIELGAPTGGAALDAASVAVEIADDDAPAARDVARPRYRQAARPPRSLDALRRAGLLRLRVTCDEPCAIRLTLNLRSIRLGSARAALRAAGTGRVTLRLSRAGRRALIGPSRLAKGPVTLVLRGRASDAAGNAAARRLSMRVPRR